MCFYFSFLPATVWAIIGYFLLFSSTKTDGGVKRLGQGLAVWAFIIAVIFPIGGAYITLTDLCPIEAMVDAMHSKGSP